MNIKLALFIGFSAFGLIAIGQNPLVQNHTNKVLLYSDISRPFNIIHPGIELGLTYVFKKDFQSSISLGFFGDILDINEFYNRFRGLHVALSQDLMLSDEYFIGFDLVFDDMNYQIDQSQSVGEFWFVAFVPKYHKNYTYDVDRFQWGMNANLGKKWYFDPFYSEFKAGLGFRSKNILFKQIDYFESPDAAYKNNAFVNFASPSGKGDGFNLNFAFRIGYIF